MSSTPQPLQNAGSSVNTSDSNQSNETQPSGMQTSALNHKTANHDSIPKNLGERQPQKSLNGDSQPSQNLFQQFGPNAGFIGELFSLYQVDPSLVSREWASYFSELDVGSFDISRSSKKGHSNGTVAELGSKLTLVSNHNYSLEKTDTARGSVPTASLDRSVVKSVAATIGLLEEYRSFGHYKAKVNPLSQAAVGEWFFSDIDISKYGVEENDAPIFTDQYKSYFGHQPRSIGEMVEALSSAYCGAIGFEVSHLRDASEREWWYRTIEGGSRSIGASYRKRALEIVTRAETLESEIHRRYVGVKRFSIEGGEAMLALLDKALDGVAANETKEAVIGMAHRGRVNVLANILKKPLTEIFREFEDKTWYAAAGSGDVKYHHGYTTEYSLLDKSSTIGSSNGHSANGSYLNGRINEDKTYSGGSIAGRSLRVTLAPNPSHLEFVNPVVEGMAKALQNTRYGRKIGSVVPIVLHGDAAVIGQGVVAEAYNLSGLCGYDVGGTLHIVINNQVGFTATPMDSRSADYCTDTGKVFNLPVLHVNGDDVDTCLWAADIASQWRALTGRGILIDLVCYRKYGHNEGDDPTFTQPVMYQEIRNRPSPYQIYREKLVSEGVVTEQEAQAFRDVYIAQFNEARDRASATIIGEACPLHGRYSRIHTLPSVKHEDLISIAHRLVEFPGDFEPHPKVKALLEKRFQAVQKGSGIDWGVAELLCYGLLANEGKRVRLTGQDAGRGTFSQRHLMVADLKGRAPFLPLARVGEGSVEVITSALSESAIIGYEFGYSHIASSDLTLWEGQFGDFVNGAQVYIDQFLSSSEAKWGQLSGLVLLLPHAYEGQGSEHSSARLERFLQIAAEGNITVAYPSTAGQYFHLLRRHAYTEPQRPLIVMSGKSVLRNPDAAADAKELTEGAFRPIISETIGKQGGKGRVILCSGKLYHDLMAKARTSPDLSRTQIIRIEQLYPFPKDELLSVLIEAPNKASFYWVQEEHENMGAWRYVEPILRRDLGLKVEYIGRAAAASTADGSGSFHSRHQARIVGEALSV